MSHVNLTQIIEKMKLENLTPEIDVKGIKITQPDINRPALQMAGYFEPVSYTHLDVYKRQEHYRRVNLTALQLAQGA